jgi:hypothetical protein
MGAYISDRIRHLVADRANQKCEYCKIHEDQSFLRFQVDHIISIKHGGDTVEENLAWSCFLCNNNKGSDIGTILTPNNQLVRFFNPRTDNWDEHFEIIDHVIHPFTSIGEATIKILKLNDIERIMERQLVQE